MSEEENQEVVEEVVTEEINVDDGPLDDLISQMDEDLKSLKSETTEEVIDEVEESVEEVEEPKEETLLEKNTNTKSSNDLLNSEEWYDALPDDIRNVMEEFASKTMNWDPEKAKKGGKQALPWIANGVLIKQLKELTEANKQSHEETKRLAYRLQEKEKNDIEKSMDKLVSKFREAVQNGDQELENALTEEYNELVAEKEKLGVSEENTKESPEVTESQQQVIQDANEAVQGFIKENAEWWNSTNTEDIEVKKAAGFWDTYLMNNEPQLSPKQRMTKVKQSLKEQFPNFKYFKTREDPEIEQDKPVKKPVKSSSHKSPTISESSNINLTEEQLNDFKIMQKVFKEDGIEYTKEKYAKSMGLI